MHYVEGPGTDVEKKKGMVIRTFLSKGFGFLGLGSTQAVANALANPSITVDSDLVDSRELLGRVKAKVSTRPVAKYGDGVTALREKQVRGNFQTKKAI